MPEPGDPTYPDASAGYPVVVPAATTPAPTADATLPTGPGGRPLTPEELAQVEEIRAHMDVTDAQMVIQYGLPAQNKMAAFADTLLGDLRTKDTGETGDALADLLVKVRELDVDSLATASSGSRVPLVGRFRDSFKRFDARYQKLTVSVDKLITSLERTRMALLKDITVLDKMYELNLEYLHQLDLYIAAGRSLLDDLRTRRIPALETEARQSPDPLVAQKLADLRQAEARFERRLHDLELSRMIAIQTAPQIRLIQSNDQSLVEKIQSSIATTVPLWKNQIVIALSLYRQQQAVELQKDVADTTNELLARNAELLRTGSAKVAKEVERGIVDVETLKKVNDDLIATLEETVRIQQEGHARRIQAEIEIQQLQQDLKRKLVELKSSQGELPSA